MRDAHYIGVPVVSLDHHGGRSGFDTLYPESEELAHGHKSTAWSALCCARVLLSGILNGWYVMALWGLVKYTSSEHATRLMENVPGMLST